MPGSGCATLFPQREGPIGHQLTSPTEHTRQRILTDTGFGSSAFFAQQSVIQTLAPGFYQQHNPVVRHTVLRRRQTLEEAGLLERVAVEVHPVLGALPNAYSGVHFDGLGLLTNQMMDEYIHLRQEARDVYEFRYKETIDPDENRWEHCSQEFARKDVVEMLSESW